MANKWIVVGNEFRISSNVKYHRNLISGRDQRNDIKGGGWWETIDSTKKIYLYSKSEEFNEATKEAILEALKFSRIPLKLKGYKFYISFADSLYDAIKESKEKEPDFIAL